MKHSKHSSQHKTFIQILLLAFIVNCGFGADYPFKYSDPKGYKTIIPKKPERIVVGGEMWPMPSLIVMLESSAKSLIYIPKASINAMKHSFLLDFYPEINAIQAGNSENIEELLKLNPDLFICHNASIKLCEAMKKSKIPTIEIGVSEWDYNSYETLKGWLDVIAPILNQEQKAQKILKWVKNIEQNASKHASQNPPKVLIIHRFDNDKSFSIGGIFANYLLKYSGATNAINDKNIINTTIEEIYRLNPDIIYLNNFNSLLPEDLLQSKLWQPLQAIQNKRVYKFPLGSYRPFAPGADLPILLLWLQAQNNPKSNINVLEQTKIYYKEVFDLNLTDTQLHSIFAPDKKAGLLE